jgi:hypothetical protein
LSSLENVARGEEPLWQLSTLPLALLTVTALSLSALSIWVMYRLALHLWSELRESRSEKSVLRGLRHLLAATSPQQTAVMLGFTSIWGAFLFFGVVGHDEDSRHLVMSVPWAITGALALFSQISDRPDGVTRRKLMNSRAVLSTALLVTTISISLIDGVHGPRVISLKDQCTEDTPEDSAAWQVIGYAPMGSSTQLTTGSDWRRFATDRTRHVDTPQFMEEGILSLEGGQLLSMRSSKTGAIRTIFMPETVAPLLSISGVSFAVDSSKEYGYLYPCD